MGENEISIEKLDNLFKESIDFQKGIEDLKIILDFISVDKSFNNEIKFDITLARGLNYYTGTIIEVISKSNNAVGSLGGGGRYDNLTSIFNLKNTSGVGISFGLDRIYLQMEKQKMFPKNLDNNFDIIVINFGDYYLKKLYPLIDLLRQNGKKVTIYPDKAKINKQFSYADKHKVNYAILMGENEFEKNEIIIKNMTDGTQFNCAIEKVNLDFFKKN